MHETAIPVDIDVLRRLDSTQVDHTNQGDSFLRVRGDVNAIANAAADEIELLRTVVRYVDRGCSLLSDVALDLDDECAAAVRRATEATRKPEHWDHHRSHEEPSHDHRDRQCTDSSGRRPTMGAETVTTWTCDRCGGTWKTESDHTRQPPNPWGSVRFHMPPKNADTLAHWVICPQCESAFAEWMYPERSALRETVRVHTDHLVDLAAWNDLGRDPADAIDVFLRLVWPSENAPWMTGRREAHCYLPRWMAEAVDSGRAGTPEDPDQNDITGDATEETDRVR